MHGTIFLEELGTPLCTSTQTCTQLCMANTYSIMHFHNGNTHHIMYSNMHSKVHSNLHLFTHILMYTNMLGSMHHNAHNNMHGNTFTNTQSNMHFLHCSTSLFQRIRIRTQVIQRYNSILYCAFVPFYIYYCSSRTIRPYHFICITIHSPWQHYHLPLIHSRYYHYFLPHPH